MLCVALWFVCAAKIRRCALAGCLAAVSSSAYRIPGNEMWTQWEGAAPSGLSPTEAQQYHLTVPFVHVGREDARLIRDALSDREEYVSAVIKAEAARLAAASSTGAAFGGGFGGNAEANSAGSDDSPSATTLAASAPRSGSVDEIISGTHGIGSSTIGTAVGSASSRSGNLSPLAVAHLNLSSLADVVNFHVYLSSTDSSNPWKDAYTSLYFVIFFQVMLGSLHLLVTLVCVAKIKRFWKLRTVRPMYAWVPILCLSLLGLANLERGLYCCLDPMGATHHLPRGYRRVMLSLSVPWTYASTLLLTFFWAEAIQRKRAAGSYLPAAATPGLVAGSNGATPGESPMAPHSPTTGVAGGGGGARRLLPVVPKGRGGDAPLDVCTAPSEKSSGLQLSSGPQPMSAQQQKQMQAARNAALKRLAARSAAAAVEAQRLAEREQAMSQHPARGLSSPRNAAALPAALDCDGLELAAMHSPLALASSSVDAAACSSPISAADPSTPLATQALLPASNKKQQQQPQSLQSPHKLAVAATAAATPLVRKSKSGSVAAASPAAHSSAKQKSQKSAAKPSKPQSAKRSPPRRRVIGGAGEFDEPFHLRIAGDASDEDDAEDEVDDHEPEEDDEEDEQATATYAESPYMRDDEMIEYSRSRSNLPFKHAQRMRRAAQEEEIAGAVNNIGQAAAMAVNSSSPAVTTRAPPAHSHVALATHPAALRIHVPAGSGSPMPLPPPPAQPPATPAPLLLSGDTSPMHCSFLQPHQQPSKHAALAMQMQHGSLGGAADGAAGDAMPRSSSYVGLQSVPLYAHLAGDAIVPPTNPASPVSPASLCSTPQAPPPLLMDDAAAAACGGADMHYRFMPVGAASSTAAAAAAADAASSSPRIMLKQKLTPLHLQMPQELEMAPLKQRVPAVPASPSAVGFPVPAGSGSSSSSSKLTPPPPFLVSYQYAFLLAFLFLMGLDLSFSVLDALYILDWQLLPVVELVFALIGVVITAMYFMVAAQVLRRLREEGEIKLAAAEYNQARASEQQQAITRQGSDDLHEWSARMLGVHRHSLAHAPSAAFGAAGGAGAGGDDHACSPVAPHSPVQAMRTAHSSPALAMMGQQQHQAQQHAHARMQRHMHAQRRPLDNAGAASHDPQSPYARAPSSPQGPAAASAQYMYPLPPFPAHAAAAHPAVAVAGRSRASAVPAGVCDPATTTLASHHAAVLASLRASHHAKMVRMWQFIVGSGLGLLLFLAVTLASPQLWHEQMHSTLDDPITTICRDFLLFLALFIVGACQVGAF